MNQRVCIVGATGAVGQEILKVLENHAWAPSQLDLFASERSAGRNLQWQGSDIKVQSTKHFNRKSYDVAFFAAGSQVSRELINKNEKDCALVVDNSSAYRVETDCALVVPEVNAKVLKKGVTLVANPNCSAIILLLAINPLRSLGNIKRVIVSTYQSASGAGQAAMDELVKQTREVTSGTESSKPQAVLHPYAFNLFSHDTEISDNGYNEEENKIVQESRKILDMPNLQINPTCIRVPILRCHSESITVEFEDDAPSVEKVRDEMSQAPGVKLVDDRDNNLFPMPILASEQEDVFVGRIRQDISNQKAISLFACGDQLLKGAALNAVQIAEYVYQNGLR